MWEGKGEGGWRERVARAVGAVQSAVCVTAEGDRGSYQQGGECEGGELFIGIGVRGLYGDGGSGMGGRRHGRRYEGRGEGRSNAGVETVAGDDGAVWITLTLTAGAAGRMVRSFLGGRP